MSGWLHWSRGNLAGSPSFVLAFSAYRNRIEQRSVWYRITVQYRESRVLNEG
jgi:hypothetical protein